MKVYQFIIKVWLCLFIGQYSFAVVNSSVDDIEIDRFVRIMPDLARHVLPLLSFDQLTNQSDIEQHYKIFITDTQVASLLKQQKVAQSTAQDIYIISLAMVVLSHQYQRDLLQQELGHILTDEQLLKELEQLPNMQADDKAEVQHMLQFMQQAQLWLGEANINIVKSREMQIATVLSEMVIQ